jgi:hypothetical protein
LRTIFSSGYGRGLHELGQFASLSLHGAIAGQERGQSFGMTERRLQISTLSGDADQRG